MDTMHLDAPSFALVFVRAAGMLMVAPILGAKAIPMMLRLAIALTLAVLFTPIIPPAAIPANVASVAVAAIGELAIGLLIGFAASLLFYAVQCAGRLLDQELGMSLAGVIDPMTEEETPVIAQFQVLIASLAWLLMNGHQFLISATVDSFRLVPAGGVSSPAGLSVDSVGAMAAQVFVIAIKLAAPALATLLLVTIAMGFLARTVPEMNLLILGYPVRIVIGLLVLAVAMGFFVNGFARASAGNETAVLNLFGGRP